MNKMNTPPLADSSRTTAGQQPTANTDVATNRSGSLLALITRLHFYAGLFVGPFIFVVALSGLLYALTPQLEDRLYAGELFTAGADETLPLSRQIEIAQAYAGEGAALWAVRPAPAAGTTTRVMFSSPELGASEHRGVFIDPAEGRVVGDLRVYGTTGVLPLRNWIGDLHRRLFLGELGRYYSELAASWLWVVAMGGVVVWAARRRRSAGKPQGLRQWHSVLGLWLLIGMLFFSATGLTWSKWAGDNIGVARAALGMATPGLSTALNGNASFVSGEHDHHHAAGPAHQTPAADASSFDSILSAARAAGIDAGKIEIRPAQGADRAWTVTEIDRSWPTQVDAVAIDPRTLRIVDQIEFARFPLAAKLTRWGIDAHMGTLFGLANQLLLIVSAAGVVAMVCMGYLMWWRRRARILSDRYLSVTAIWVGLSWPARIGCIMVAIALGVSMPVFGASLAAFLLIDILVDRKQGEQTASPRTDRLP